MIAVKGYKKLEDYGLIGNLNTCALVGRDGSIDWCCFPHIESPSVFAAILDAGKGGNFAVRPQAPFESEQQYIHETNVLQTIFQTDSATATLVDFMPLIEKYKALKQRQQAVYRKITCNRGSMEIEVEFKPRFDYARTPTVVSPIATGVQASCGDERLFLHSPFRLKAREDCARGSCSIEEGETLWLVLQYGLSSPPDPETCQRLLSRTIQKWADWSHICVSSKCVFAGPWHDLVVRSGLVLDLLIHHATGAICAAPTTSLPEEIGGVRNWDYRFNWVRDASFTIQALYNLGYEQEAKNHLNWFMGICRKTENPSELRVLYGMHGGVDADELELDHLSGYRNSRPVRIGNAASNQVQLDIYGELINAVYETSRYGHDMPGDYWPLVRKISDYVCKVWMIKDAGIWEVRGEPQHFVYSKLMCWVALDRGIKIARRSGFDAPLEKWSEVKNEIREAILTRGFSRKLNSFAQSFGSEALDATGLLIPTMGFLPFGDPRVRGTINATLKQLTTKEGFVYRYRAEDGLPGSEGAFILCSFWLVKALALSGRVDEAEELFVRLISYASPLGLLAEEVDPGTGDQLGNFPQAFSHIGLINSALYIGRAKGKRQMGPEPLGGEQ